ncbi:MAG: GAF sensor signal transduction histidine kinase [Desulfotomaculum sp. 46_80]|nr:MAG: GAF sensor signal transduction histidine kinase [Desulfotomaculum sp. 46_80]
MELFDLIPVGISITLNKTYREIRHNKKAAEFLRIQPREALLHPAPNELPLKIYHRGSELSPEEMPVQRALGKGETVKDLELDFVWEDGMRKTAIWNSNLLLDGEGAIIGAISAFEDITERIRVENELKIINSNLIASQEIAHTGSFTWDLENKRMVCSDELYRILGLIPGKIKPSFEAFISLIHPEDREKAEREILRFIRKGKKVSDEFRIVKSDGTVRFIRIVGRAARGGGKPALIIGVVQDVTRQKQAEKMLRETRDYLENLIGYANASIIVWDTSCKITKFNHAFERLTGYTEDKVLGRPLDILFPENSKKESLNHIRQTSSGEFWEAIEIPILGADGSIHTVLWNSANIYNKDKTGIIATIAQGQDITRRKEAEEAVYANRNLMFNIIDGTSDLVVVKDFENRLLLANRALAKITGKPFGEIIGYDINKYYGHEAGQMIRENDLKVMTSGRSEVFEETIPTKDGDRIFLANKFPYRNKSGELIGVIGISRDITERKKTEEKILFKNAMVEGINRILQESLTCANEQELGKTCLNVAQEITGSQIGLIGEIDQDGFLKKVAFSDPEWFSCRMPEEAGHGKPPEDIKIRGVYKKMLLEGRSFFTNIPVFHPESIGFPEGHPSMKAFLGAPLTYNGKTIGMISLANREGGYRKEDVETLEAMAHSIVQVIMRLRAEVALKKSEERYRILTKKLQEVDLRQSEERFHKAFHSSPAIMFIQNLDGRFLEANDKFIEVSGFSRDEIIGRNSLELNVYIDPSQRVESFGPPPELIKSMHERKPINNLEVKIYTKRGEQQTGLLSTDFIELNSETCILIIINDITELRRFEKKMSRLDRLSLVGEMAGGLAHEIRNPIAVVRGYLEYIGEKKEFRKQADRFQLMISELDRVNSIITEYLTLARGKAYDAKPENLNVLIKDLNYLVETDAIKEDKYINLELEEVPDLLLEKNDIKQMILNLIRNGLEAMAPGGYLTVRTSVEGEKVILAVCDQGKGIPPEHLDKMGIPFFTTKDYGTGLGLAICYKIAARHNAEIHLETSPEGTTFFVKFTVPGARVS